MTRLRCAVLLIVSMGIGGCALVPHYRYYAPAVSGVITQEGHPVGKAEVRVSGHFSDKVRVATSEQDGRFAAEPIREFVLIGTLIGEPLYAYEVQIILDGTQYAAYVESGAGEAPERIEIRCELAHPIQAGKRQFHCSQVAA